ncbi:sulfatase-like hydrolase/transferase [candidate division KSB1 bacterium]|nr:sulfatase-like hydrolase/transferase [candidate division KSB1 bacterium]NIR72209.1 sulfatase-like hydrolase/transferase [candidate division KSB1 bacterium]NIS26674.1 sulfatase-like hydrolase/transferase [candidate division KSB1 bacterium]NIT73442.1 sulfatase-like hydrolase/transferase [candidate division KSB1 bacterium]NIU27290.1 sulfatase-like hydrolase/transferase [candidate division KSB1 bacterium]
MQTAESNHTNYLEQIKLCLYYGLVSGVLIGIGLAFYKTWFGDQYIQKGLSVFVLEIFSEFIFRSSFVVLFVLLLLFPGISFISRNVMEIRNLNVARLASVIGGLVWVVVGYQINKTSWFPPVLSVFGIVGNAVFSMLCLALTILIHKILHNRVFVQFESVSLARRLFSRAVFSVFALFFVGFNLYAYYRVSSQQPAGANLVMITIDTLRADRLGCYGYEANTSPTIDRLAAQGTRFEHVYAQRGLTWPSLTSIMTSLYPKTHGVLRNQWPLDGEHITLAEILKNSGYKTGAFVANFYYAPNRGFDLKKGGEVGELDKTVTRDALEWLDGIDPKEDRFFMWIHYKNPHDPYTPPKRYTNMFDSTYTGLFDGSRPVLDSIYVNKVDLPDRDLAYINALYDAEIRSTDTYIDRVLKRLEKMDVMDSTLIVFSSDHGEELYEHNYYFFHGCSMYDGVLRIPLIFKFPDVIAAGKVIPNQIESIDITPTILQLLKLPLRQEFEGRSVLPMLFETDGVWYPAFGERINTIFSIRTPQWKYIYNPDNYHTYCSRSEKDKGEGYLIEAEELYDVKKDPKEQKNVVAQHPDIAKELRAQIIQWANTNKKAIKEHKLTKEAEERLRALGYIK